VINTTYVLSLAIFKLLQINSQICAMTGGACL